jgi:3-isopropylmalate dehydratase small subunit
MTLERTLSEIVVPLDRADADTHQILPKQFLKRIERTGFGQFLFHDWRFALTGEPNRGFVGIGSRESREVGRYALDAVRKRRRVSI